LSIFPQPFLTKKITVGFISKNFFQTIKEKGLDPPEMIIDDRWEKAFQNG